MIISLDTECTGLDLAHGAMPFLVTWCELGKGPCFVEWPVDPHTRRPQPLEEDLATIAELMDEADLIYLHNAKFDCRALATIGLQLPWAKVRDTLIAGHLLGTNEGHKLEEMCVQYLDRDIKHLETNVKVVTQACRAIAKKYLPHWSIAREGAPGMPSVVESSKREEDKPWKNDMWLARALIDHCQHAGILLDPSLRPDSSWATACSKYACGDSEHTVHLGQEVERQIRDRGLWAIYEHRLQLPRVDCEMETYGVTAIGKYTTETMRQYEEHVAEAEAELDNIAFEKGHALELAKGAAINDNMRDFFYGAIWQECPRCGYTKRIKHWNDEQPSTDPCPRCLKPGRKRAGMQQALVIRHRVNLGLPVIESDKTGNATLDKGAMQEYIETLEEGPALDFVHMLADKRMYDTALTYMHAYQRFWVPVPGVPDFYRIHPSINPCGTDHLRQACNSPNMQNVSGESKQISNRACFGPAPGREWWSMDYRSIEARLPAYESGEPKMIEVFEHPDEPPYWGNLYNLTASVLYRNEYWPLADKEGAFRKAYPLLYKQAKFFVLAKNYGAGRRKGDLLSKVKDSYDLVDNEFPLLARLQNKYLRYAERTGCVETLPDRSVDPTRGYPILAARTDGGRILSTTPFNYHISGTACWCKNIAMVRCSDQCAAWRAEGFDAYMILEVHDELLFDLPRGSTPEENLPRAVILKELMERSGTDLVPSIPTPVKVCYHDVSWADGREM